MTYPTLSALNALLSLIFPPRILAPKMRCDSIFVANCQIQLKPIFLPFLRSRNGKKTTEINTKLEFLTHQEKKSVRKKQFRLYLVIHQ